MDLTLINERRNNSIFTDGKKTFKIFNKGYKKTDVFLESYITSIMEEDKINVPKIKEVYKKDNQWTFEFQKIEGESLYTKIQNDPDNIDEYLDLFVKIQTDIHKHKAPQLPIQKEKLTNYIKLSNLDKTLKDDILDMLNASPKHKKVCHGNLTPHNVYINDEGEPFILDWNHASQGNASADVARTFLWIQINMPQYADSYLQKFCDATNTTSRYVKNWIPIVAAARLSKNIPEEMRFLTSLISVIEY